MKVKVNILPTLTWRYLKVNHDEVEVGRNHPVAEVSVKLENAGEHISPINIPLIEETEADFKDIENGNDGAWLLEHLEFLSNGYHLRGQKEVEEATIIKYSARKGMLSEHNVIEAGEGEKVRVVIFYEDPITYLSSVTRIYAKKGSEVEIIKIHAADQVLEGFDMITALVEEDANVEIISVEMGGKHSLTNYQMELLGDRASGKIESVYIGKGEEKLDIAYRINHHGKKNRSEIVCNGILKDRAKKTFKGTLDFKKGSAGSKGAEVENATLLDKGVISKCIPTLLCTEHDVEGDHAASAGRLDESLIFYLMSRGYEESEARRMLILSSLTPTIEKIPKEEVRKSIFDLVEKSMRA